LFLFVDNVSGGFTCITAIYKCHYNFCKSGYIKDKMIMY